MQISSSIPFALNNIAPPILRKVLHLDIFVNAPLYQSVVQVVGAHSPQLLDDDISDLTVTDAFLEHYLHNLLPGAAIRHLICTYLEKGTVRYLIRRTKVAIFQQLQLSMCDFHGLTLFHDIPTSVRTSVHDRVDCNDVGF